MNLARKTALERLISSATKLECVLPTDIKMEIAPPNKVPSLDKNLRVETQDASKNTEYDIRELLGIDKALQAIQVEMKNNASKLTEINK